MGGGAANFAPNVLWEVAGMATARILSLVFQPAVTFTLLLAALVLGGEARPWQALWVWCLLAFLPALALALGMRLGVWTDIEVTRLRERHTYLPLCSLLAMAAAVWAVAVAAPYPLRLLTVAVALWLGASTVVSFAWKISLHEGATVGVVLLVGVLAGALWLGLLAWAPLAVAWARLRLERHTPAQLAAGALAAAAALGASLALLGPRP
jgi:hypothetical protein